MSFSKCGHNRSILVIFLELNVWVTAQEHWTLITMPQWNPASESDSDPRQWGKHQIQTSSFWFIMMWRLIKLKLICVGNVNASFWFWYQINVMVYIRHWDTTSTRDLQTHFTECFKICQFYLRVLCSDLQLSESSYWCQNIFRNWLPSFPFKIGSQLLLYQMPIWKWLFWDLCFAVKWWCDKEWV